MNSDFWNKRFSEKEYAYGVEPSIHFKSAIDQIEPGHILLCAEGEGRNAVYAAKKGWKVTAFDASTEGRLKTLELAEKENVEVDYIIADLDEFLSLPIKEYDAVGMVYFHLPPPDRKRLYATIHNYLKSDGTLIIEGFNPDQVIKERSSGGPRDEEWLFTCEIFKSELKNIKTISCQSITTILDEGPYHQGLAELCFYQGTCQKK